MASRKELKEERRLARERIQQREAAAATRRRRVTQLAAVMAAAVVVVVVAIAISSGGGDKGASTSADGGAALAADVATALQGIEQNGATLGKADAPVTMDYYGDLQCPVCRQFTEDGLAGAIQTYVRPGTMKIVYRSLETATQDPATFAAQQGAAVAAGAQNRLWQYIELFYRQQGQENSGYVTDDFLKTVAGQVPDLDRAKWETDRTSGATQQTVRSDATTAAKANAQGTPTLVIAGPKGKRTLNGPASLDAIRGAVEDVS